MSVDLNMTIGEARAALETVMYDEGAECPCCTQFVKVYRRKVNAPMANALIAQYREAGKRMIHTRDIWLRFSKEAAQLSWWGLIRHDAERRADGGQSGWWAVTDEGERFIRGEVMVPKYAVIYDGRVLDFEGDQISITDALGTPFEFRSLMAGA